jgi:prespore-specific regulator
MAVKRQDAWTEEDDLILAEVTLRQIREGGTQLSAFEEAAERLGRTPAACGFRWNSTVRKKYESAIQIAKAQRQKRNLERSRLTPLNISGGEMAVDDPVHSIDHIIRFLRQHKNEVSELFRQQKQLEKELEEREHELKRLETENLEMRNQLNHVQSDYRLVNDDYRTLVQIMERAHRMALLSGSEEQEESLKIQSGLSQGLEPADKD